MSNATATPTRIHPGRIVRYFAGYGGLDGQGMIVRVHGTPRATSAGGLRVIRPDSARVDVILYDGRTLRDVHECGIDAPGIGIKTLDLALQGGQMRVEVQRLEQLAADFDVRQILEKTKARADFEAREAARQVTQSPLFYYNGIKDKKGAPLQKAWFSDSPLRGYPEGTITIYARDYDRFSASVRACFAVENKTDIQTDYFDSDTIRVIPSHPLYAQVRTACDAMHARRARRVNR